VHPGVMSQTEPRAHTSSDAAWVGELGVAAQHGALLLRASEIVVDVVPVDAVAHLALHHLLSLGSLRLCSTRSIVDAALLVRDAHEYVVPWNAQFQATHAT
jgi:hypothetical protein